MKQFLSLSVYFMSFTIVTNIGLLFCRVRLNLGLSCDSSWNLSPILLTPKFLLFNDFLLPKLSDVQGCPAGREPLCRMLSDCHYMKKLAISLTVQWIGFPGALGWGLGEQCSELTTHGQGLGFTEYTVAGLLF